MAPYWILPVYLNLYKVLFDISSLGERGTRKDSRETGHMVIFTSGRDDIVGLLGRKRRWRSSAAVDHGKSMAIQWDVFRLYVLPGMASIDTH